MQIRRAKYFPDWIGFRFQASAMIHALKLECNISRSVPAYMLAVRNLNPKLDEFFNILGYDE